MRSCLEHTSEADAFQGPNPRGLQCVPGSKGLETRRILRGSCPPGRPSTSRSPCRCRACMALWSCKCGPRSSCRSCCRPFICAETGETGGCAQDTDQFALEALLLDPSDISAGGAGMEHHLLASLRGPALRAPQSSSFKFVGLDQLLGSSAGHATIPGGG